MTNKFPNIPVPRNDDLSSIVVAISALRDAISLLARNAQGQSAYNFFALGNSAYKMAAVGGNYNSSTPDCTCQFTMAVPGDLIVICGLTGIVASAAGTMQLKADGNLIGPAVALPITGGNAYPFSFAQLVPNIGSGPHNFATTTTTNLAGTTIAVFGTAR